MGASVGERSATAGAIIGLPVTALILDITWDSLNTVRGRDDHDR
jgi:hypothetical protein